MSSNELLAHFMRALAYRTDKALRGAPDDFLDFTPGPGVRTTRELLAHMANVLTFTRRRLEGEEAPGSPDSQPLPDEQEVGRFRDATRAIATLLSERETLEEDVTKRLLQGPLADVMTHAGQIAMFRRLAGSAIPGENFYVANLDSVFRSTD